MSTLKVRFEDGSVVDLHGVPYEIRQPDGITPIGDTDPRDKEIVLVIGPARLAGIGIDTPKGGFYAVPLCEPGSQP